MEKRRKRIPGPTWLKWVASVLTALMIALIIVRILAATSLGRGFVEAQIEALEVSGQTIDIDGLEGDLLGAFSIDELTVTDSEGEWVAAENLSARWSPWSLFSRTLRVSALEADLIHVQRRPELGSNSSDPSDGGGSPLNRYRIDAVDVRTLQLSEGVAGPELAASLGASLDTTIDTGALTLNLRPTSPSGDRIQGDLAWGEDVPLRGTLTATGPERGLIASVLSPTEPGPIDVTLSASGEVTDWRADALLKIGAQQPLRLEAKGDGATRSARADVMLIAFADAAPLVEYLGPKATISLDQGERITVAARSAALEARAEADWDPADQRPDLSAIDTDLQLKQALTFGDVRLGGGTVDGVLSVDGDIAAFDGAIALTRLDAGGIAFATLTAPGQFEFDREAGRLAIDTTIDTQLNDTTSPEIMTYLGTEPSLTLKGDVDLDTRLSSLETATLRAAAGIVTASGTIGTDRSAIDLSGTIQAFPDAIPSDIELREGRFAITSASDGALQISLAAPARLTAPPHPLLEGMFDADFDARLSADNALTLSRATLAGDTLTATASGAVSADALDLDLTAEVSAFTTDAYAVEGASLKADVEGSIEDLGISARLGAPSVSLGERSISQSRVTFDGRYISGALSGAVNATANVEGQAFKTYADFAYARGAWQINGLDTALGALSLTGSASGGGDAPISANLALSAPEDVIDGVGAASGTLVITGTRMDADVTLASLSTDQAQLGATTLTASGPLSDITGRLDTSGEVAIAGQLRPLDVALPFQINAEAQRIRLSPDITLYGQDIDTIDPIEIAQTPGGLTSTGALSLLGGSLRYSAERGENSLSVTGEASEIDAAIIARLLDRPALRGGLNASFELSGEGQGLIGTSQITVNGIAQARPDAPEVFGTINAALGEGRIDAAADLRDGDGGLTLEATAGVPVSASAAPLTVSLPDNASIDAQLEGRGPIEPIWSLIGPLDTALDGRFDLTASVQGPLENLRPEGRLTITDGQLEDALTGLNITDIAMEADLVPEGVTVRSLTANGARGGSLTGSGRYGFGGAASVEMQLDRFNALQRDDVVAVVSGDLALFDEETGARLTGALDFQSAEINIDQLPSGGYTTLDVEFRNGIEAEEAEIERPERVPIALDIDLNADRRIRVIGRGVETEWRLDASLGGTVRAPRLRGQAEIVRGDVEVLGRTFPLEGSTVDFNGAPEDARLGISAQRTEDGFTAGFAVRGTVSDPDFALTSTPQVPNDEILSRVLFGTSPSQLSPLQAAQLAAGLAQLSGGGGVDLLGGFEDALNVDRIELGLEDDGTASLGAGKYIAEDVYLEVRTTTRGAPGLGVEWTPRQNVEVGAEFGAEVTPRFTIQWTRDYGGPDEPIEERETPESPPDEEAD